MIECRETFFRRLDFHAPSDLYLIRHAYDIAKATHKHQVRMEVVDGKPLRYFEHPRRVALIAIDELGITDPHQIALLLLHDVLEDAPKKADMSSGYLEYCFDKVMTRRAQLLTIDKKAPNEPVEEKSARKKRYTDRLHRHGDIETVLAKGCDRLDNLRSMRGNGISLEFIERKTSETRTAYLPIFEGMIVLSQGTLYQEASPKLLSMLLQELARCEEYARAQRASAQE